MAIHDAVDKLKSESFRDFHIEARRAAAEIAIFLAAEADQDPSPMTLIDRTTSTTAPKLETVQITELLTDRENHFMPAAEVITRHMVDYLAANPSRQELLADISDSLLVTAKYKHNLDTIEGLAAGTSEAQS